MADNTYSEETLREGDQMPEAVMIRRAEDGFLLELTPVDEEPKKTSYYWYNGEDLREADEATAIAVLRPGTEPVESAREKQQIMNAILELADWISYDREKHEVGDWVLDFCDRYYGEQ